MKILLFSIKANVNNKHLGRHSMKKDEDTEWLDLEQYRSHASKVTDTQDLNMRLFYDIIILKQTPTMIIFADIISNYDLALHSIDYLALHGVYMENKQSCVI